MNVLANIFFGIGVFFSKLKNTERVVKIEQRDFIDDLFDIKQTDNSEIVDDKFKFNQSLNKINPQNSTQRELLSSPTIELHSQDEDKIAKIIQEEKPVRLNDQKES